MREITTKRACQVLSILDNVTILWNKMVFVKHYSRSKIRILENIEVKDTF